MLQSGAKVKRDPPYQQRQKLRWETHQTVRNGNPQRVIHEEAMMQHVWRLEQYAQDAEQAGGRANAFAERWVGTIRRDCLDWLLIVSRKQLEARPTGVVDYYNTHRPHRHTSVYAARYEAGRGLELDQACELGLRRADSRVPL
jgi:hypothetical protein